MEYFLIGLERLLRKNLLRVQRLAAPDDDESREKQTDDRDGDDRRDEERLAQAHQVAHVADSE